jgi:S-adenosylmethionine:tRNA ribosyltransferase-isomerase
MQLSEFDFPFDSSLIATEPVLPREQARLLVLKPSDRSLAHRRITDLPDLLVAGDLLVVNDTRVRAARVMGRRRPSGKSVEILFVKPVAARNWEVLMKGIWHAGQIIDIDGEANLTVLFREAGRTVVRIEGTLPIVEFFQR